MFNASGDDDKIAFAQLLNAVAKIDRDPSAQHKEGFVLTFVRMPVELGAEFRRP